MDVSKRNLRRLMAIVMVFMLMFSTVGTAFAAGNDGSNATSTELGNGLTAVGTATVRADTVKGGTGSATVTVGDDKVVNVAVTLTPNKDETIGGDPQEGTPGATQNYHLTIPITGLATDGWELVTGADNQGGQYGYDDENNKAWNVDTGNLMLWLPVAENSCKVVLQQADSNPAVYQVVQVTTKHAAHYAGYDHVFSDYQKDSETGKITCKLCGEEITAEAYQALHETHDWTAKDGVCVACGAACSNTANHPTAQNPGTCNICGLTVAAAGHVHDWNTDWSISATHHWHECKGNKTECNLADKDKDGYAAHDKNGANGACSVCGYKHEHTWTAAWANNDTHHWHECTADGCDVTDNAQKNAYGAHVWTAKDGVCATCKMKCSHAEWDAETGVCKNCGMACAHAKTTATALTDADAGYHKIVCDTCGKVVTEKEKCDTDGTGNACSKCGYKAPVELDNGLTVVGTAAVRADTVKNGTGAAVVTTEGDVVKVAVTLTSEPGKTIGGDPQDGQPTGTPNYHLTIPITGLTTADWKLVTGADNQGGQYGYDDATHPEWNVAADNLMLWLPVTNNTCKIVLKTGDGNAAKYQVVEVTTVQVATPAHPDGYVHVFADFELVNGVPTCKADGCDVTITMVEYQRLHNPHTWAEDKSGVCDVCGIACPNTSNHSSIVAGETCETCGFVGTKHVHHWTDGVCDGAGTCPGCSLSDSHATILKGETCPECGLVGTYVAPVTVPLEVEKSVDNGTVKAEPVSTDVASAITDARTGDDVSPVAPVNLVVDMADSTGDVGAATLTLAAATVKALVDAQTVEVEDSEGQTTSVSAPVTLVVMNTAGAVALPIEAVTMAQDSDTTASVVVDLANVTSSDLKDQLTATQEGGQDVYKDDQGAVVDVDNAVALDVTLSKNTTPANVTGLTKDILVTMKAPDGAKGVKVYFVDEVSKVLKFIETVLVDENGNATFGIDHLTTFVMVETHVHDWTDGVCANPNCPGCPDAANHANILTTHSCPTCGLPGEKHTEVRDAHNLDSFNEDGSCKHDTCHYTLTQFQESCPLVATHANLLTTQKCEECGFVGTGHNNTFAAHDKNSFDTNGDCRHTDCDYTLAKFQSDCDKNGGNHADILTSATCPICGAAGTKTGGGGGSHSGSSGNSGTPTQKPDTTTTTDPETGAVTVTTKNPDGSSVVTITQKDGTKTTTNTDANGKTETTVELKTTTVEAAAGDPVKLPMNTVAVTKSESSAETVTVKTENGNNVTVAIPASGATAGTVAMVKNPDGTYSVMKDSIVAGNTVVATVANGATVKLVDRGMSFADMTNHWATNAVAFATARDLFNGTSATTFSPNAPMTRAMVVTVLARYDGVDTNGGTTWYAKGIEWAMSKGVSDGTNPTADISREQLVTMLWRYVGEPGAGMDLNGYTDATEVSSYAANAMRWAVENGVIKGRTSTTLAPKGQATRAEVAQIFQNLLPIAN